MDRYEEGLKLIEERCGNSKDNLLSLATIATKPGEDGKPRPYIRDVDAYYEDGVFYVTTWAKSNKMQQIAKNPEVAFAVSNAWFSGNGIAENRGWVLDPKNAEIRAKMRQVFAPWYDEANDESNENCVILAIHITRAIVVVNHGQDRYFMDFVNKVETTEGSIK